MLIQCGVLRCIQVRRIDGVAPAVNAQWNVRCAAVTERRRGVVNDFDLRLLKRIGGAVDDYRRVGVSANMPAYGHGDVVAARQRIGVAVFEVGIDQQVAFAGSDGHSDRR